VAGFDGVGIFDVKVVIVGDDVFYIDAPSLFGLFPAFAAFATPPLFFDVEFFDAHGPGFVIGFIPFGELVFEVPDIFGGFAFFKEQQVGFYAGVWREY